MKSAKRINTLFIVGLVFSLIFISSAIQPVNQSVILIFGNSAEEQLATTELIRLNPNSKVVNFGDFFSGIELSRSFNALFVVGHGSNQGMLHNNKIISWNVINQIADSSTLQTVYYVTCNSYTASQNLQKPGFGFHGEIEPILGSQVVSYLLNPVSDLLFSLIQRVSAIINTPEAFSSLTLYVDTTTHCGWFSGCWGKIIWSADGNDKLRAEGFFDEGLVTPFFVMATGGFVLAGATGGTSAIAGAVVGILGAIAGLVLTAINNTDKNRQDGRIAWGLMVDPFGVYFVADNANDGYGIDGVIKFTLFTFLGFQGYIFSYLLSWLRGDLGFDW